MKTQLILGEESPTPQQKKKGRFAGPLDPFSEGINVVGPSSPSFLPGQIEPPPIPTPALLLSSYMRGQVEDFPIDLGESQDSIMEVPPKWERALNDSRHASTPTRGLENKENADDEEMMDEEEERTPREPFQQIWEGQ